VVATYDDANLVVQLTRWGSEMQLDEAVQVLFSEGFDPASASTDEAAVRKVLGFGEVVGTLVKQGVLNRGLVLDLWWVTGLWARVEPAAKRLRERLGEDKLYENFEALAAGAGQ
jgi:Domain of unknown function (DUF4760)